MKRIYLVTAVALMLSALILVYSQTPRQRAQIPENATAQTLSIDKQVSTQQRINRYFHGDVMAKIKSCWSNVQGKGTIGMKHVYNRTGERWTFTAVDVQKSNLPSEPTKIAFRCMSDSLRGSSFAIDPAEIGLKSFVLNWTWPVPFPTNETQLTRAMFAAKPSGGGSSSGGCDGHGTEAKCYACKAGREDLSCQTVCVGKETCTITMQQGGSKTCGGETACASGGPFGVAGTSRVIY